MQSTSPVESVGHGLFVDPARLGLVTDLYELTMAAGYWATGLADRLATFELFFRDLPPRRGYMVAAGLEQAVQYLLSARFTDMDIEYLRSLTVFAAVPAGWFDSLRTWRFSGELWAVPEGTVVFGNEPLLRVTAPLGEAQIVETFLLTTLAYQTSVASKAARVVSAARGRDVVDFGSRRAHGPQAGLLAARAAFIGGCTGTSNVEAARLLAIPPIGTMAHSWVMAFRDEEQAFQRFAAVFPDQPTFLVDTYDTLEGVRRATRSPVPPGAIRLDSGDLADLARHARKILDDAGMTDVHIFASGDLNEARIDALIRANAPIDAFGVGTELTTVADAPSLGCVYKLVEIGDGADSARIKLSSGKRTYPGAKQIFRRRDGAGVCVGDVVGRASESLPGDRLLEQFIRSGQLMQPLPSLRDLQRRCRGELDRLPPDLRAIDCRATYPVTISAELTAEFERLCGLERL